VAIGKIVLSNLYRLLLGIVRSFVGMRRRGSALKIWSASANIGDGRFQSPKNSALGVGTFDMAVGDFNRDGKLDVALAGYVSPTQSVVQIMLGSGDGTFRKGQTINLPANTSPRSIATGDFNNDGHLDLALALNQLVIYKGAGNGTFTQAASIKVGTQTPLQEVRIGDFNADERTDIELSDGAGLYLMWSTGGFAFNAVLLKSSKFGIAATPVDVNQDGFTDLLVTYYTCSIGNDIQPGACTNWEVLLGSANRTFRQSANFNGVERQRSRPSDAVRLAGS